MTIKIVANSDTHNYLSQIKNPQGDLYIHSGDWTLLGQQPEMIKFGRQVRKLKYKHKILIPGNHDLSLDPNNEGYHHDWVHWLGADITTSVIVNKPFTWNGIRFYCTSLINPIFNPYRVWAFESTEKFQRAIYEQVTEPIDILISHAPPYGIMDEEGYGSRALYDLVMRLKPKIHFFGHCHENRGVYSTPDTLFVNAAICNRQYQPVNKPIIVDYDEFNRKVNNVIF